MTSKEALAFISKKAIQYIKGSYPVIDEEGFENYEKSQMVLGVLVERDTPMKVIKEVGEKYIGADGFYDVDVYKCGVCAYRLIKPQLREVNFCPKCGKRLDWIVEND